jgi:hypothetical protein
MMHTIATPQIVILAPRVASREDDDLGCFTNAT